MMNTPVLKVADSSNAPYLSSSTEDGTKTCTGPRGGAPRVGPIGPPGSARSAQRCQTSPVLPISPYKGI